MDKKISLIVPVYKSEWCLERCLNSIIDQDWKNKEIVVVMDGESKEAEKIIKKVSKVHPIISKTIEHAGACAARHAGYEISTGDVLSFFNSDYVAYPGMIRTWMEALEDNPDCGFVYGGYAWCERDGRRERAYESEEFDAYKLESYNYIDCGNPIRREVYVKWDSECKSLQDWDFFLRIVRNGVKGKYIPDIVYEAELPFKGGLSDDSSSNWLQRVKYVKDKNGIPNRDICVSSLGAPKHGINVAKMLNADFKPFPNFKPHNYRMVYLIGFYKSYEAHAKVFAGLPDNCIKVIHWVGADIYWLRDLKFAEVKHFMRYLTKHIDYHLVECEQMQQEMADYGIKSDIVPIAPPRDYKLLPMPEEFSVAIMKTNKSDFDKYCGSLMDEIMVAMPDIKFKVFGDGKCTKELPNVENLGYVNMDDLLSKTSCFLRIVRHDGMMMAANEFVMSGRDAITNLKMPFMEFIDTSVDDDNWDKFGAGFNIHNYPKTKEAIIQRIRDVKNGKAGNKDRVEAKKFYDTLLDKGVYNKSILGLLGSGKKCK